MHDISVKTREDLSYVAWMCSLVFSIFLLFSASALVHHTLTDMHKANAEQHETATSPTKNPSYIGAAPDQR